MEAETGPMQLGAKECQQKLAETRTYSPLEPPSQVCSCQHLDFGPLILMSNFWTPEL